MNTQKLDILIHILDSSLKEDGENSLLGGNIIQDGYDMRVDEYRKIIGDAKDWLNQYQKELIEETGITSLRIKFTQNSGYFIEIQKSHFHKVSTNFIHIQTLVNASRFFTEKLKVFQLKILEAEQNMAQREYEIFNTVRQKLLDEFSLLHNLSYTLSFIDFYTGLAEVSHSRNYIRPKMHTGFKLELLAARHPVIETINKDFISNDLSLSEKDTIHIITGPNMGGKSTYLRQNALIILLSHIGSFIPAKQALVPIVDRLFSRVGAYDNLYMGQSTFMVEMQEISNILHNATERSFIIVDEIGRGTSTYDGMSLAWAILKFLHNTTSAKTLFATHYHEISDMSHDLKRVSNLSMAVSENNDNIVFLRKVIPGSIKKSYGIEVAKIAGIPKEVVDEARKVMYNLQSQSTPSYQMNLGDIFLDVEKKTAPDQKYHQIYQDIQQLNIENLTPLEALTFLSELQQRGEK